MKQKLSSEEEQAVYDLGYDAGTSDQFVPMAVVGIVCAIVGGVIGMCL